MKRYAVFLAAVAMTVALCNGLFCVLPGFLQSDGWKPKTPKDLLAFVLLATGIVMTLVFVLSTAVLALTHRRGWVWPRIVNLVVLWAIIALLGALFALNGGALGAMIVLAFVGVAFAVRGFEFGIVEKIVPLVPIIALLFQLAAIAAPYVKPPWLLLGVPLGPALIMFVLFAASVWQSRRCSRCRV